MEGSGHGNEHKSLEQRRDEDLVSLFFWATPVIFSAGLFVMGFMDCNAGLITMIGCFVGLGAIAAFYK